MSLFKARPLELVELCGAPRSPADSILAQLNDSQFQRGLEALREHAATAAVEPVVEPVDFFVFRAA